MGTFKHLDAEYPDALTAYKVTTADNKSCFTTVRGWMRIYKQYKWIHMRYPAFVFDNLKDATAFARSMSRALSSWTRPSWSVPTRVWRCSVVNMRKPPLKIAMRARVGEDIKRFWTDGTLSLWKGGISLIVPPQGTMIADKVMLTEMLGEYSFDRSNSTTV